MVAVWGRSAVFLAESTLTPSVTGGGPSDSFLFLSLVCWARSPAGARTTANKRRPGTQFLLVGAGFALCMDSRLLRSEEEVVGVGPVDRGMTTRARLVFLRLAVEGGDRWSRRVNRKGVALQAKQV